MSQTRCRRRGPRTCDRAVLWLLVLALVPWIGGCDGGMPRDDSSLQAYISARRQGRAVSAELEAGVDRALDRVPMLGLGSLSGEALGLRISAAAWRKRTQLLLSLAAEVERLPEDLRVRLRDALFAATFCWSEPSAVRELQECARGSAEGNAERWVGEALQHLTREGQPQPQPIDQWPEQLQAVTEYRAVPEGRHSELGRAIVRALCAPGALTDQAASGWMSVLETLSAGVGTTEVALECLEAAVQSADKRLPFLSTRLVPAFTPRAGPDCGLRLRALISRVEGDVRDTLFASAIGLGEPQGTDLLLDALRAAKQDRTGMLIRSGLVLITGDEAGLEKDYDWWARRVQERRQR